MSEREFAEIVYRALKMILLALEKRYAFGPCAPGKVVEIHSVDSIAG